MVNKYNSIDYIASYETQQIFSSGLPFIGIGEEILIGIVFTLLWFGGIRIFAYGWISDALIDFISVFVWSLTGFTPIQLFTSNPHIRFFFREILFSYLVFGVLLWRLKPNIKKLSLLFTLTGIVLLIIILT